MTTKIPDRHGSYRLVGAHDDKVFRFRLQPGALSVGSSRTNDVVVAIDGVSRRHARLRVTDDGRIAVEDLGSKNGTFLHGKRITAGEVNVGDAFRLGPVELRFERTPPEDIDLAIVLPEPSAVEDLDDDTTAELAQTGDLLGALEALFEGLENTSPEDLSIPLQEWCRALSVTDACLVTGAGTNRGVILGTHGDVRAVSSVPESLALQEQGARDSRTRSACVSGRTGPFAYAVLLRRHEEPWTLTIRFGDTEASEEIEGLVRVTLRILARTEGRAADAPTASPDVYEGLVFPPGYVPGASTAIRRLYRQASATLSSDLPVLIEGETGVGKEWIARILHASSRRKGAFVPVNCAAIPRDLLEAELFGVEEGVATGVKQRQGKLPMAERGTVFLDEIGELPGELQAKLLRALQEREVTPLGGSAKSINVRFVAATNNDLMKRVEDGLFRKDLYYRVAGVVLRVPPLRERRQDIAGLVEHFLRRSADGRGHRLRGVTVGALAQLSSYDWPGNVRELEHELVRLAHSCTEGQAIDTTLLPERIVRAVRGATGKAAVGVTSSFRLKDHVNEVERRLIGLALEQSGGSQRKAARLLEISRNALARKVRDLRIREQ